MSYSLFDKDEHWHKPEQAFLTDDHRTILRFAVEALMSGKGAVLVTLVVKIPAARMHRTVSHIPFRLFIYQTPFGMTFDLWSAL